MRIRDKGGIFIVREKAAHQWRAIGNVSAERVLAEVQCGVLGGGEPDEGGEDGGEIGGGGERRPPMGVAEIGVAGIDGFGVPGLEFGVGEDGGGVRIVMGGVDVDPMIDGGPDEKAVVGVRVVGDQETESVRLSCVFHGDAPAFRDFLAEKATKFGENLTSSVTDLRIRSAGRPS